jgi:hypothetical protein
MDLPIFELTINEDEKTGVDWIALVDRPAIQIEWQAFSAIKEFKFVGNDEKRIISGPAMIPDLPIIRKAKNGQLYNVFFKAETIRKVVQRFFKNNSMSNFNEMHTDKKADGTYLFESFLIDTSRGINTPSGYDTLPDGTWWISCKVENEDTWNNFIKTGEFNGFSVEGFFKHQEPNQDEELINAIVELF